MMPNPNHAVELISDTVHVHPHVAVVFPSAPGVGSGKFPSRAHAPNQRARLGVVLKQLPQAGLRWLRYSSQALTVTAS